MKLRLLVVLAVACSPDSGPTVTADAPEVSDAAPLDAPFQCVPRTSRPAPPACLALDSSTLQGATPFGALDVTLDSFAAGDCITISAARVVWTGACGERLSAQFSYPAVETGSGRRVTGGFDTTARFTFEPPGMAAREDLATIHVDVTTWQEGADTHDIDITVTVVDAQYALAPVRVSGTFCDWPYWLC